MINLNRNNNKQGLEDLDALEEMLSAGVSNPQVDSAFAAELEQKLTSLHLNNINNSVMANKKVSTGKQLFFGINPKIAFAAFSFLTIAVVATGLVGYQLLGGDDSQTNSDDTYYAEVTYTEGDVQIADINDEGKASYSDADSGASVSEGQTIRTYADSRAIIQLDDGSAIRLNENSEVNLASLDPEDIRIKNNGGEVYARVIKADREFVIATDNAEFRSLGTAYETTNTDEVEGVTVYESDVLANLTQVGEGKEFFIKNNKKDTDSVLEVDLEKLKDDEFVQWNKEQDEDNDDYKNKLGVLKNLNYQEPVEEEETTAEEPVEETTPGPYMNASASATSNGIKVNWSTSGLDTSKGFKVVYSTSPNPAYGQDSAQYVNSSSARSAFLNIKDGKYYYIKVCTYTGSGCTNYSNQATATAPSGPVQSVNSISISNAGSTINWTIDGSNPNGVKVVWSKTSGPTYPTRGTDTYKYISTTGNGSVSINPFDGAGTYYVRVCEYLGNGTCGKYSNQITVDL